MKKKNTFFIQGFKEDKRVNMFYNIKYNHFRGWYLDEIQISANIINMGGIEDLILFLEDVHPCFIKPSEKTYNDRLIGNNITEFCNWKNIDDYKWLTSCEKIYDEDTNKDLPGKFCPNCGRKIV